MRSAIKAARATRVAITVATLGFCMGVAAVVPAEAATSTKVSQCINGTIGPYDVVGQWTSDATYRLKCGDPTKGLLHIADGHGGDAHTKQYGAELLTCMSRIAASYNERPGNTSGTTLRTYTNDDYGTASFLYNNSSKDILTAYTGMGNTSTGSSDSNWWRCANN